MNLCKCCCREIGKGQTLCEFCLEEQKDMRKVDGVVVRWEMDGIGVISICDMPEEITRGPWEVQCRNMREWCEKHDSAYYGAPRASFNRWKGVDIAKREGRLFVVVEDLS